MVTIDSVEQENSSEELDINDRMDQFLQYRRSEPARQDKSVRIWLLLMNTNLDWVKLAAAVSG